MILNNTIEKMYALNLQGMAKAFEEQLTNPAVTQLPFEDRVGLMVDREETHRENERMARLLRNAKLKYRAACVEDVDYSTSRGLDKSLMAQVSNMIWVRKGQNLLVTGSTGTGKTWIACAVGNQACRHGLQTLFCRIPTLLTEIQEAHGNGEYKSVMKKFAKPDLLILDDLGVGVMDARSRADLLEVIESRSEVKSTIVTSQLPVEAWHGFLGSGNKTVADAIMDRVVGGSIRLTLNGDSMRRNRG